MSTSIYKAGDRVRCVDGRFGNVPVGTCGTVREVDTSLSNPVVVTWDGNVRGFSVMQDKELELISSALPPKMRKRLLKLRKQIDELLGD